MLYFVFYRSVSKHLHFSHIEVFLIKFLWRTLVKCLLWVGSITNLVGSLKILYVPSIFQSEDWFQILAVNYEFTGKPFEELCDHNAQVTFEVPFHYHFLTKIKCS